MLRSYVSRRPPLACCSCSLPAVRPIPAVGRKARTAPGPGDAGTSRVGAGRGVRPALAAVLVWAGVVVGMLAIGSVVAAIAIPMSSFNRIALPIADLLLIVLGVLLLAGVNPFARLPRPAPAALGGHGPRAGAFLYGLLFAPIAVPCSGPFLVGIFAFSLTIADAAGRLAFFAVFGLGFGLPLFLLGIIGHARGAQLAHVLVRDERPVQLVLGAALVVVGLWDLGINLPLILG
jgi:cytochrome c-type biogenesis protein